MFMLSKSIAYVYNLNTLGYINLFMAQTFLVRCAEHTIYNINCTLYLVCIAQQWTIWYAIHNSFFKVWSLLTLVT